MNFNMCVVVWLCAVICPDVGYYSFKFSGFFGFGMFLGLVYIKTFLFKDGAIATDNFPYSPHLH